ncbi:hypothetical protein NE237_001700 [Protea cynaroides]|uniref:Uncharacterized protein n=1 Tax=Protea cynaroides TaxID=273540 RepID=A0A9Q0KU15_9MAGN|nr:hypothetical protein NE237_001700 [Protea cynaroides]
MAKARLAVAITLIFSLFLLSHAPNQPLKPEDLDNIVVEWKPASSSYDLLDSATDTKILLPGDEPKQDSIPKFEVADDAMAKLPSGSDGEKHHYHHHHHHNHKNQSHCHHHHHKNHTHSERMEEKDQMEKLFEQRIAEEESQARKVGFLHGKRDHDHKPSEEGEEGEGMMGLEEGEMKHRKKVWKKEKKHACLFKWFRKFF